MARQRFAPTHSLTGTPRYVPAGDSSWRSKLIPNGDDLEHPYWLYMLGQTRFDLDDPALVELIDLDAKPETWTLRALKMKDRHHVRFLVRRDLWEEACAYAFVRGVVSAENLEGEAGQKLAKLFEGKKRDHDAIIEAAGDYAGNAIEEVGNAIINLSADLAPREKKASASQPGSSSPSPET